MPIVNVMVPMYSSNEKVQKAREEIQNAFWEGFSIPQSDVTVEFSMCLYPERLVVRIETRSETMRGELDRMAQIVGQIIEAKFYKRVECLAVYLSRGNTGIYLT